MDQQSIPEAIGQSEAFLDFKQHVSRVATVDRPVLIVGERGTGKELVAARLHYLSKRWEARLITLNCAALSPSVMESELFGHEEGAFTGATQRRRGRFESADGGTLFLDEVGLIPMIVQEKILRVVEYGSFERVGGSDPISVNTRIIGATNADLPAKVREGKFKDDLLDRLAFEVLHVPPLRERHGDIALLANYFALRMAVELGLQKAPEFGQRALDSLENYNWPGNVRELKNVIERAVYRSEGKKITRIEFNPFKAVSDSLAASSPEATSTRTATPALPCDYPSALKDFEISMLIQALRQAKFHQGRAAKLLGLNYNRFRALYRKHEAHVTRLGE